MAHIAELVGATLGRGARHVHVLRDVQARAGRASTSSTSAARCRARCSEPHDLMHHAEQRLGVKAGGTTPDGMITLERAECQAACTEAPNAAGQLPLPPPRHPRDARHAARRSRAPASSTATSRRTASSPACASASRRPASSDPARPKRWTARRLADRNEVPPRDRYHLSPGRLDSCAGDRPRIVTSRFEYDDGYTLERYQATGGYEGLAKALAMTPDAVHEEVTRRNVARSRWRRVPRRHQVGPHAPEHVAALSGRQRRRERAGHLQGPPPHGARSPSAHRGLPHRLPTPLV